jgi:anti-anti-sigma regulatory factor
MSSADRHGASRLAQAVIELHRERREAAERRREPDEPVWVVAAAGERERRVLAAGDVDRLQAALLKSHLLQLGFGGAGTVVVDLTAAETVDGGVIASLLSAGRRLQWRDVQLRVVALAGSPAAELLASAGLPAWIEIRTFAD